MPTIPTPRRALILFVAPCLWLSIDARAEDYPPRKPGLWEVRITPDAMSGRPPMGAVQQCVDANTDRLMREMGGGAVGRDCSKQDVRHEAGRLVIDSVCKMQMAGNPTTATTHAVITGSFDSSYRMESKSSYSPPFMGRSEGGVTMDAKWLGPCKADQKPGDMVMPGGVKVNVLDAASAAAAKK
jgi:hypothetical protein